MNMENENPLIDLKSLTEPLSKLVDALSTGMGNLYSPFGTVRQAKADAEAKIIHAVADSEVLSLQQRAVHRVEYLETQRQLNLEKISVEAAKEMPSLISNESVSKDWILQFFDAAKDVCDDDMQKLWGRLLAEEVAKPDSYSKRTLHFLKTMDKTEAVGFSNFCRFAFADSHGWNFIFGSDVTSERMAELQNNIDFVSHFMHTGLISSNTLTKVSSINNAKIKYFGDEFDVTAPEEPKSGLGYVYDRVSFTQIGQELSTIVKCEPVDGYAEQISEYLEKELSIVLSPRVAEA